MRSPQASFSNTTITLICALLLSACMTSQTAANRATEQSSQQPASEGALELQWEAPKDRVNGTPLQPSDIAGYRIYVGETPGHYNRTVDIDNPKTTHFLLQGLEADKKYYVAITTIDREGRESPKSGESQLAAAPLTQIQTAKSN